MKLSQRSFFPRNFWAAHGFFFRRVLIGKFLTARLFKRNCFQIAPEIFRRSLKFEQKIQIHWQVWLINEASSWWQCLNSICGLKPLSTASFLICVRFNDAMISRQSLIWNHWFRSIEYASRNFWKFARMSKRTLSLQKSFAQQNLQNHLTWKVPWLFAEKVLQKITRKLLALMNYMGNFEPNLELCKTTKRETSIWNTSIGIAGVWRHWLQASTSYIRSLV